MGMTDNNLCKSCINLGCEFQSGIVRTECAFYMPPHIEPDNCGNYVVQDSTTKSDLGVDCVARQDVERFIEGFINEYTPEEELEFINLELNGLKHLPSVTPQEPKIGHWIMTGDYYTGAYGTIDYVECSCCHEDSLEEGNYCPNCGAKMVEPQESEE